MTTTVRYPGGPERIGVPRSEPLGQVPPGAVPGCGGAPGRTPAGGGPSTPRRRARVAVFTDNDFVKVNGVTTALSALLRYAPPGVDPCVYTHSDRTAERPGYVAMPAPGIGLPFYREMRVYLPRLWALCARVRADGIDLIDLASSRARRGAMSAAARRYAESRRWERAFAPLYDAYREVAAQPRSVRPRPAASPRRRAPVRNAGRCDPSARAVLADVVRRPRHHLIARWNWKAALLSAGLRGLVFFAATRSSGLDAARTALAVEFAYRVAGTGCFAALTQAFSRATPGWAATAIVIVAIPAAAHVLQYGVHRLAGTVELDRGMAASVAFTVVSAAFTLYAMRRGVFIVGDPGRRPFWRDLADMPGLVAGFVLAIGRGAWRCVIRSGGASRMGRLA